MGAAMAASTSNNPLFLGLLLTAVIMVVLNRRTDAPWARAVGAYLTLALIVIIFRVALMALLGGRRDGVVLFTLPEIPLPAWAAGIRFGGPVTANALLAAGYDGLRLAGLMVCVGAANTLANPRQALKSVPAALNQLSVAVIIALALAPQLVESLLRIRRARRLRGGAGTGWRAVKAVLVPVLEDALDRSMRLAAAMESRGYGRAVDSRGQAWPTSLLLILSLCGLVFSTYALLSMPELGRLPWAILGASVVGVMAGLHLAGRSHRSTRYRPHRWRPNDTILVALGVGAAALAFWLQQDHYAVMNPRTTPLQWPQLHWAMLLAVAMLALPAVLTPPPATRPTASRKKAAR